MKLFRRFLSLVLVLSCIISSMYLPSSASSPKIPFEDVSEESVMCADVSYAWFNGLMNGVSEGSFAPYKGVTRAQFVTILGRIFLKDPEAWRAKVDSLPFTDVNPDAYYAPYVCWAVEQGIIRGVSTTRFAPNQKIIRQDAAVMIVRSQKLADPSLLKPTEPEITFPDGNLVSEYAREAVRLLQRQGILKACSDGRIHPQENLPRYEIAGLLSRYHARLKAHSHDYRQVSFYNGSCTYCAKRKMACSCGSYYIEEYGKPLGHAYKVTGYTEDRQAIRVCSRCGKTDYQPLPEAKRIYSGDTLLRYGQISAYVDKLAGRYPDLIRVETAGYSLNGLKIPMVSFGKGSRYILLNGNIHAREYITTNYLLEVLDEYAYAYVKNESIGGYPIRPLLDTFTLVIIPCSNPDGRAIAMDRDPQYKNNGRGVDLNRNFPTNWLWDSTGIYGSAAGSEPETQVLMQVMKKHRFELVLDCHTAGNVIYYGDGDCTVAQMSRSKALAEAMAAASGFMPCVFSANAGFANYARHPYGTLGFTVEMWPTYEHPIDCSGFYTKIWTQLGSMPAVAMDWLRNH